jgi:hypothetical protein
VPVYSEQETSVALPTARPTPSFPKKAAEAPESIHRSKLTFAPYWLVPVRPFWEQRGLPSTGQRLLTVGKSMVLAWSTVRRMERVRRVSWTS